MDKSVPASAPSFLQPGIVPLPGEVCSQLINCGKAGCRCQQGERHGPYYYRVWREGDTVRKVYVKRENVEQVQAACRAYKDLLSALRQVRERRTILSRSIHREQRRYERMKKQMSV